MTGSLVRRRTESSNVKIAAVARAGVHPQPATVHLDDPPRDREPEPGAALGLGDRIVGLLELLEQLLLIGGIDSRPGVVHRHAERAIGRRDLDRHFAGVGELDRVADQIEQHLGQLLLVAVASRHVGRHVELEAQVLLRRQRLDRAVHLVNHVLHRIIGERQLELARLDLGEVEHVIDQAEQMAAVALDALEHGQRLLRRLAVDAVEDQLGVADDGVERGAQLVAHVGEELRLVLARLRELPARFLDLVEQPHVLDRDHRLVGEGGDQLDLLVGERLAPSVRVSDEHADRRRPRAAAARPAWCECRQSSAPPAKLNSGSASTSGMWTTLPSSTARPVTM